MDTEQENIREKKRYFLREEHLLYCTRRWLNI